MEKYAKQYFHIYFTEKHILVVEISLHFFSNMMLISKLCPKLSDNESIVIDTFKIFMVRYDIDIF